MRRPARAGRSGLAAWAEDGATAGADRARPGQPPRRQAAADLDRVRQLLDELEEARRLPGCSKARATARLKIFIGSEN